MSREKIAFKPFQLYTFRDLLQYIIIFTLLILYILITNYSFSYVNIFYTFLFTFLCWGYYIAQIKVFEIQELVVDADSVYLRYFIGSRDKSFPRPAVCFKERESSWMYGRGINVYVNGHEVATIDSRFNIDAIIAHPEIDVERA